MYGKRWKAVQDELERTKAGAFVVSYAHNIRYLCCTHLYTAAPPTFLVFRGKDAPIAITSWLESARTEEECAVGEVRVWGNLPKKRSQAKRSSQLLSKVLKEFKAGRVLSDRKLEGVPGVKVKTSDLVERCRAVKDQGELALIRRAAGLADHGALVLDQILKEGRTEREVANELDFALRERGAQAVAFPTIIAAGPHSAYPHHDNLPTVIEDAPVVCDFGAYVEGYCSDITRTRLLGRVDPRLVDAYRAVQDAVDAGTAKVRAGRPIREVDLACREVLWDRGFGEHFVHSTGHGIGLEVHESPTAGPRSKDIMKRGMVFTIEPGVYINRLGGVRIENDVLVTSGGAEVLTKARADP